MQTKSLRISSGGVQTLGAALGRAGARARSMQIIAEGAGALIGGSDLAPGSTSPVVAAVGFPIPSTRELYLPYVTVWTDLYEFDAIWVDPNGTAIDILYEVG